MDSKFSVFRTSMTPSMYNSNNSNTTLNIVSPRTDNASTRRTNQNYCNPNQQKPLNNLQTTTAHPYGYIRLSHSPYDPARTIPERIKSYDKYYDSLTPKYKSAMKKSKNNESFDSALDVPNARCDKPIEYHMKTGDKNKKIKFETENDVCFTVDKEFYVNHNLKNTVWWSAQELLFIRNIVMAEAVRIQRNNPNLKICECIKEICKNS